MSSLRKHCNAPCGFALSRHPYPSPPLSFLAFLSLDDARFSPPPFGAFERRPHSSVHNPAREHVAEADYHGHGRRREELDHAPLRERRLLGEGAHTALARSCSLLTNYTLAQFVRSSHLVRASTPVPCAPSLLLSPPSPSVCSSARSMTQQSRTRTRSRSPSMERRSSSRFWTLRVRCVVVVRGSALLRQQHSVSATLRRPTHPLLSARVCSLISLSLSLSLSIATHTNRAGGVQSAERKVHGDWSCACGVFDLAADCVLYIDVVVVCAARVAERARSSLALTRFSFVSAALLPRSRFSLPALNRASSSSSPSRTTRRLRV